MVEKIETGMTETLNLQKDNQEIVEVECYSSESNI